MSCEHFSVILLKKAFNSTYKQHSHGLCALLFVQSIPIDQCAIFWSKDCGEKSWYNYFTISFVTRLYVKKDLHFTVKNCFIRGIEPKTLFIFKNFIEFMLH